MKHAVIPVKQGKYANRGEEAATRWLHGEGENVITKSKKGGFETALLIVDVTSALARQHRPAIAMEVAKIGGHLRQCFAALAEMHAEPAVAAPPYCAFQQT